MKNEVYLNVLYDCYRNLLTEQEEVLFESYYFDNLSLAEISENIGISRNAIHKHLKKITEKLLSFESKLHINDKEEKILKLIQDQKLKKEIENIFES